MLSTEGWPEALANPGPLCVSPPPPGGCWHSPPLRSLPSSPVAGRTVWRVAGQGWLGVGPPLATPELLQAEMAKNSETLRPVCLDPNQVPRPRCQARGMGTGRG